jgi:hypothetical protein
MNSGVIRNTAFCMYKGPVFTDISEIAAQIHLFLSAITHIILPCLHQLCHKRLIHLEHMLPLRYTQALLLLLLNILLRLQVGDVCELLRDVTLKESITNRSFTRVTGEEVKIISRTALNTTVGQI